MRSSSGRPVRALVLASLLLLSGCAATKVREVWKDGAYEGRPKSVLVVAVARNVTVQREIESGFARRLKERGAVATEGFRVLPQGATPESDAARDAVVAAIREQGIEAVLLTRVVARRSSVTDIPGMTITRGYGYPYGSYGAWGGYTAVVASSAPMAPTTQGYTHESKFLDVETHLFDVRTEKLVWAIQTESLISGPPQEEIRPYVDIVAKELFKARIF